MEAIDVSRSTYGALMTSLICCNSGASALSNPYPVASNPAQVGHSGALWTIRGVPRNVSAYCWLQSSFLPRDSHFRVPFPSISSKRASRHQFRLSVFSLRGKSVGCSTFRFCQGNLIIGALLSACIGGYWDFHQHYIVAHAHLYSFLL